MNTGLNELKGFVKGFMDQQDFEGCKNFCQGELQSTPITDEISNRHLNWYLHFVLAECFYKLNRYPRSIFECRNALIYATDIEFEIKTKWVLALCYTDSSLNETNIASELLEECISFYKSEGRYDLMHVLYIIKGNLLNDETLVEKAIEVLLNQCVSSNPYDIDYTYYLDEAYFCLHNIYLRKDNGLMAYKAYHKIVNKKNYTKGD